MPLVTISDQGLYRTRNEDFVFAAELHRPPSPRADVAVVCDGMGGFKHGDVAAALAARTILQHLVSAPASPLDGQAACDSLRQALLRANDVVFQEARRRGFAGYMGTTAVAAYVTCERCVVAWCGDSRAYSVRRGVLTRLTNDHTRAQERVDKGELSEHEAANHDDAHSLISYLGFPPPSKPRVEGASTEVREGDLILAATDGLTGELTDREIGELCRSYCPPQSQPTRDRLRKLAEVLVEHALARGGPDNVSLALVSPPAPEPVAADHDETLCELLAGAQACLF